jgi:hypothetical protein
VPVEKLGRQFDRVFVAVRVDDPRRSGDGVGPVEEVEPILGQSGCSELDGAAEIPSMAAGWSANGSRRSRLNAVMALSAISLTQFQHCNIDNRPPDAPLSNSGTSDTMDETKITYSGQYVEPDIARRNRWAFGLKLLTNGVLCLLCAQRTGNKKKYIRFNVI